VRWRIVLVGYSYMRSCVWLSAAKSRSFSDWIVFIHKQMRDEFNLDAVRPGSRPLPGKPQQVASGGAVLGTVDAARDGAVAPKSEPESN
jgi:hypothetical protein